VSVARLGEVAGWRALQAQWHVAGFVLDPFRAYLPSYGRANGRAQARRSSCLAPLPPAPRRLPVRTDAHRDGGRVGGGVWRAGGLFSGTDARAAAVQRVRWSGHAGGGGLSLTPLRASLRSISTVTISHPSSRCTGHKARGRVASVASAADAVATPAELQPSAIVTSVASVADANGQGCTVSGAGEEDGAPVPPPLPAPPGWLGMRYQPSWTEVAREAPPGAWCGCCGRHEPQAGGRWWRERVAPSGWRCWTCHPPLHLAAGGVCEVVT
jgi:hypothetical protein